MFRGDFWAGWKSYYRLGWGFCRGGGEDGVNDLKLELGVFRLVWVF